MASGSKRGVQSRPCNSRDPLNSSDAARPTAPTAGADQVLISAFGDLTSVVHQLERLAPALEAAI
jgi:hypothetical protein